MALLQRTRILPNERIDLPDYNRIEDFVCADFKALNKQVLSNDNFVLSGFVATGIGTNTLSIGIANSSLLVGADDGVLFVGAPSLAPLATSSLSPGATNYVEIFIDQDTGGADSRAFWDSTAAGGQGAEFSQIVDTFTFLQSNLSITTSNFSGDSDKVRICEVDTNGSGVITAIRDRRDLFYRLGRGTNVNFVFPWSSRVEPPNTQFTGADKDIKNQKQLNDALMNSIREINGTNYWFEQSPISLSGSFRNSGLSILTAATTSARFSWSGTQLSITDDNGTPLDADVLAYIRILDSASVISLTRQQAGNAISLADDQVLWVELPDPLANVAYDGVGVTSLNYRVSARGSVPLSDDTYWLAYRGGTKLYVRGLGELEAGESSEISDNISQNLLDTIGLTSETAAPVYSSDIRGVTQESLVSRIGTLTDAIGDEQEDRSGYLRSDDPVSWDGVNLSFTSDVILEFINTKNGTVGQHIIAMAQSPITIANLESAYILIDRTDPSEACTVVLSGTTPIPAQSQANKDVFILFRRVDVGTDNFLHIPFHKQLIGPGQTIRLGLAENDTAAGIPPLFVQEAPAGAVDGSNDTFTLTHTPKNVASVEVHIDTLKVIESQVTVVGTTVTLSGAAIPQLGQSIEVFYIADTANSIIGIQEIPTGTVNGINDSFVLAGTPINADSVLVLVDGLKVLFSEWTLVGSQTIQFHAGSIPQLGQSVEAYYVNNVDTTLIVQEVPTGTVNGINDTFTLSDNPPYKNAVLAFVDGREVLLTQWSLVHIGPASAIKFAPGFEPALGQSVEAYYFVTTGGGTSGSLQDAYNNGSTITTVGATPFTVGGAATKVAQFNGDIGVTGVIDPKGITFIRQSVSPIDPADDGLWMNTSGDLMQAQVGGGNVNVTQGLGGGGGSGSVDKVTLSGTDISNGFITLSGTPTTPADVILNVIGGLSQDYGVDFTVSGATLSWSGLALDGVLVSGDKLIVQFN